MLVSLARRALRLSSLPIALAALVFLTFSPAPAKADICTTTILSGLTFPGPPLPPPRGITQSTCTTDLAISPGGTITVQRNNAFYTNSNNALISVTNNSSSPIFDLFVTGFPSSSTGIFQFTSADQPEMLCSTSLAPRLACGNALATTGDEGIIINSNGTLTNQIVYFTGIAASPDGTSDNFGDVIFSGDLLPGQTAIFGTLEDVCVTAPGSNVAINCSVSPVPVPEPGSFAVLGTGLLGLAFYRFRRRRAAVRIKLAKLEPRSSSPPPQQTALQLKPQQS